MPFTLTPSAWHRAAPGRPAAALWLAVAACASVATPARADTIDECKAVAEQAEVLRSEAKLVRARELLLQCAHERCPRILREACTRMFTEVEASQPTVIVRARDARGRDVVGVRVFLDGAVTPLMASLTGTAVPIDPGPHRVRYEAAGAPAIEEDVLIAEGDRRRVLWATFTIPLQSDGTRAPAPAPGPAPQAARTPPADSPSLAPIVVAGSVGLVGFAAFTYLHASAWAEYRDLEGTCGAGGCPEDDIDAVRTRLVVADVSLGVGIAASGLAVALALLRARDQPPSSALRVHPQLGLGSAGAMLGGTF